MRRGFDQRVCVFRCEMGREQGYRGKMEATFGQCGEKRREATAGTGSTDPLERGVVRVPEIFHAEGMHGRIASRSVEMPRIHLREMREKHCRVDAVPRDKRHQLPKEFRIAEMDQRMVVHESTSTGAFGWRKQGAAFARAGAFARPRQWRAAAGPHCRASVCHSKPVCTATAGSGMSRSFRISLAPVAACPAWQLLKNTNVFWVFWFSSRILSAHSFNSASE